MSQDKLAYFCFFLICSKNLIIPSIKFLYNSKFKFDKYVNVIILYYALKINEKILLVKVMYFIKYKLITISIVSLPLLSACNDSSGTY